jgi:hypothetical protein
MASEISTYQRLPGKKKGFLIGHHTLWQGPDHLLQIYSRLGVEDYKRFYFNDIQAVTTRKTGVGTVLSFVLGVSTVLYRSKFRFRGLNSFVLPFCSHFRGRVVHF